jgi:hypothetical protein
MCVVGGKSRGRKRAIVQNVARNSGKESSYMERRP